MVVDEEDEAMLMAVVVKVRKSPISWKGGRARQGKKTAHNQCEL